MTQSRLFSHVPNGKIAEVARMLKAIHAQEPRASADAKGKEVIAKLKEMKLRSAAELVEQKVSETLTYYAYPSTHWRQVRTNNPLKRIIREIRRRTRVVGTFAERKRKIVALSKSEASATGQISPRWRGRSFPGRDHSQTARAPA